jgi:hypothetical protein
MDSKEFYLKTGSAHLSAAGEELYKPEEDIVPLAVCKFSQSSILNYLKGYLKTKGIESADHETIQDLYAKCVMLEPAFKKVDLQMIDCRGANHEEHYCDELDKVRQCHGAADQLDTVLRTIRVL